MQQLASYKNRVPSPPLPRPRSPLHPILNDTLALVSDPDPNPNLGQAGISTGVLLAKPSRDPGPGPETEADALAPDRATAGGAVLPGIHS
jgi:hypothetical protein